MDRQNASRLTSPTGGCSCPPGKSCYEDCPATARMTVMPPVGPWEKTPWWIFWQPSLRRQSWIDGGAIWLPGYEYQHPAFAAREVLDSEFNREGD